MRERVWKITQVTLLLGLHTPSLRLENKRTMHDVHVSKSALEWLSNSKTKYIPDLSEELSMWEGFGAVALLQKVPLHKALAVEEASMMGESTRHLKPTNNGQADSVSPNTENLSAVSLPKYTAWKHQPNQNWGEVYTTNKVLFKMQHAHERQRSRNWSRL